MKITSPKREARYRQLLDAALKVFARDGIDAASVADIAEAAGVAKGSVYLYFDSKEALAGDLVRHLFHYEDDGPRLSDDPQPLARILSFCDRQEQRAISFGEAAPVVLHMFGHIGKTEDDHMARGVRQLMHETRFMIEVLVASAQSRGLLPASLDVKRAAAAIEAATFGAIHQRLAAPSIADHANLKAAEVVKALLKGLGAKL